MVVRRIKTTEGGVVYLGAGTSIDHIAKELSSADYHIYRPDMIKAGGLYGLCIGAKGATILNKASLTEAGII